MTQITIKVQNADTIRMSVAVTDLLINQPALPATWLNAGDERDNVKVYVDDNNLGRVSWSAQNTDGDNVAEGNLVVAANNTVYVIR